MKVRLNLEGEDQQQEPGAVEMDWVPRVGEFLELEDEGTCEVTQVLHTPQSAEQAVILKLRKPIDRR